MFQIMRNPVLADDGFSYEHDALELWFQSSHTSPISNKRIVSYVENQELKKQIDSLYLAIHVTSFIIVHPDFLKQLTKQQRDEFNWPSNL